MTTENTATMGKETEQQKMIAAYKAAQEQLKAAQEAVSELQTFEFNRVSNFMAGVDASILFIGSDTIRGSADLEGDEVLYWTIGRKNKKTIAVTSRKGRNKVRVTGKDGQVIEAVTLVAACEELNLTVGSQSGRTVLTKAGYEVEDITE